MSFLAPFLLMGSLLAAVPLIIHLRNKSRVVPVKWGAMMFLQEAVKVRAQRIKLQQLILLLLRMACLILLALAMARPILNYSGVGGSTESTCHVIIMDASYSMRLGHGQEQLFEQARRTAMTIVDSMSDNDSMMIIWAGHKAKPLFSEPAMDKVFLRNLIQKLEPGQETMNLRTSLNKALWTLEGVTQANRRIYILCDQQSHNWDHQNKDLWQKIAKLKNKSQPRPSIYINLYEVDFEKFNLQVQDIHSLAPVLDTHRPGRFRLEVFHGGKEALTTHLDIYQDSEKVIQRELSLSPGSNSHEFELSFSTPGFHHIKAVINQDDDLEIDNSHYKVVEVQDLIPVLLIDGSVNSNPFESEGRLLARALSAKSHLADSQQNLFHVKTISYFDIEGMDYHALKEFRVVVLASVPSFSQYFQFALEQYVERGGGLFMALGEGIHLESYQRLEQDEKGLLPLELLSPKTMTGESPFFKAGQASFILQDFDLERSRVLKEAKIKKMFSAKTHSNAITLASVGEDPLLVYKDYQGGRVACMTSSAGLSAGSLPLTHDYLPLMQNLVMVLAASVQPPVNLIQGEKIIYEAPSTEHNEALSVLINSKGLSHEIDMDFNDGLWTGQWNDTVEPGLYEVKTSSCPSKFFAVRLPKNEGQLTSIKPETLKEMENLVGMKVSQTEMDFFNSISHDNGLTEFWQEIILLLMFLLCLEMLFSWRFSQ
ncbi:MAG: BatA domain-containing protein [Planctomycetes bacterium]|nr:BatA domain-containing protein [Planctomycetota bacterium]